MAEAHSVAALSVSLTHDGISVSYDQELLCEIWHSFLRAYKKRIARFKVCDELQVTVKTDCTRQGADVFYAFLRALFYMSP